MKLLYFAWIRSKTGVASEEIELPPGVGDVRGLLEWLRGRGGGFAEALADLSVVRVAVNQEYVKFNHPVRAEDEIAMFPPVTGG
jgi:molybdopterin synthase sulfur carrier subunit